MNITRFVMVLGVVVLAGMAGWLSGFDAGCARLRADAVQQGAGYWVCDPTTGDRTFQWVRGGKRE